MSSTANNTSQFNFENLRIYQDAIRWVNDIYKLANDWPKTEQFGLTNQLRRAASSIPLNIAEGSSRTSKDFAHFLSTARGSCFECAAILDIAKNQEYITSEEHTQHYAICQQLARTITALKTSIAK